jgi:hypothetical protein
MMNVTKLAAASYERQRNFVKPDIPVGRHLASGVQLLDLGAISAMSRFFA